MDTQIVSRPTGYVNRWSPQAIRSLCEAVSAAGKLTCKVVIVNEAEAETTVYMATIEDSGAGWFMTVGEGNGQGDDSMSLRNSDMRHLLAAVASLFSVDLVDAILA